MDDEVQEAELLKDSGIDGCRATNDLLIHQEQWETGW